MLAFSLIGRTTDCPPLHASLLSNRIRRAIGVSPSYGLSAVETLLDLGADVHAGTRGVLVA